MCLLHFSRFFRTPVTPDHGLRSVASPIFDQTMHRVSYVSTGSSDIDDSGYSLDRRRSTSSSKDHGGEGLLQPTFYSLPHQHRRHNYPVPSRDSGLALTDTNSLDEISKALDREISEIDEQFIEINK